MIIDVLDTFLANDDPGKNGWNDWYIPAYGQLELMYKNKSQINTALANMEGAALNWSDNSSADVSNGIYWSSSELEAVDDLSGHHPGINIDGYGNVWFGAYEGYFYASLRVIRDIN